MAKKYRPTSPDSSERRPVQKIGSLVNQLLARRGYAQIEATEQLHAVISSVLHSDLTEKQLGEQIIVGKISRGVLQVFAADSVILQELTFQKRSILKRIQKEMPQSNITDVRFKVQALS